MQRAVLRRLRHQRLHPAAIAHFNAALLHQPRQRPRHVARLLRRRKNAPTALHHHRASRAFQQLHHILRRKERQRTVQEPRIPRHFVQELIQRAVIGDVAAPFPGDVHLLAQLFAAFQQRHARARFAREDGCHHPRRAAANHNHPAFRNGHPHGLLPPNTLRTSPKWIPAA